MSLFYISDAIGAIHRAQSRANRLRVPQAVIEKEGELIVTTYRAHLNPLEICWPSEIDHGTDDE